MKVTVKEDLDNGSFPIVNIAGFTTEKKIYFQRPDKTQFGKDATFFTNGTDGILYYDTVAGDLNQSGSWKRWAYIRSVTSTFTGSPIEFEVDP